MREFLREEEGGKERRMYRRYNYKGKKIKEEREARKQRKEG